MAWQRSLPANNTKIRLSPAIFQGNNSSLETALTATTLNAAVPYIPDTHAVFFYANTPPTGWTLVGSTTDCLLALKGGSSAYNVTGGQVVGTWVGPGYSLTISDIPVIGSGGSIGAVESTSNDSNPVTAHHHDWTSTRPYAAVGILCTKNA